MANGQETGRKKIFECCLNVASFSPTGKHFQILRARCQAYDAIQSETGDFVLVSLFIMQICQSCMLASFSKVYLVLLL